MASTTDRWSDEEIAKLAEFRAKHMTARQIANAMGVSFHRVRGRMRWHGMSEQQKEERREYVKRTRKTQYSSTRTPRYVSTAATPTPDILEERAQRIAAPYRDIAGMLFGDPPVGYSALERRV